MPLQEALDRAEELYMNAAIRMFRFIRMGMEMNAKMKADLFYIPRHSPENQKRGKQRESDEETRRN